MCYGQLTEPPLELESPCQQCEEQEATHYPNIQKDLCEACVSDCLCRVCEKTTEEELQWIEYLDCWSCTSCYEEWKEDQEKDEQEVAEQLGIELPSGQCDGCHHTYEQLLRVREENLHLCRSCHERHQEYDEEVAVDGLEQLIENMKNKAA